MPLRFRCEHCQQLLSVGSKKAGAVVSCPKCQHKLIVPGEESDAPAGLAASAAPPALRTPAPGFPRAASSQPPASGEPPTPAEPPASVGPSAPVAEPFPEFNVYEYETEYIYVEDEDAPPNPAVDLDKVAVPRWALYAQGALLAVVAVTAFAFGLIVGGAAPQAPETGEAAGPWSITGQVTYNAGDHLPTPDAGATVLLLPEDARPEEKAAIAPFRPGGPPLDPADPALATLQQIGGDVAQADAEGKFRLRAPQTGLYFLLILSAHLDRGGQRPPPEHLAEIGRYFESAPELLGDSRYAWTRRRIREHDTIAHVFR